MAQRLARFIYNKRNRRIAAGALFTGLLLKNSLKHIFPDDLFFPFYAYPTSEASIIDAAVLLKKCKTDMGLLRDTLPVMPFISMTTEVCSAGFAAFGLGQSQIGIPQSFLCDTVEQLSHYNVLWGKTSRLHKVKGVTFEKIEENEIKLLESLLMSDDAKRFSIARHLSYFKHNWALYQSVLPSLFVLLGYSLTFHSSKILFSTSRGAVPIFTILGMSLAGAFVTYLLCKVAKALLCRKISVQADLDAASISPEYAKGGVEMYEKLSETNKALRILLGRRGEALYTAEGNHAKRLFNIFNPNEPNFTKRREYIQKVFNPDSALDMNSKTDTVKTA